MKLNSIENKKHSPLRPYSPFVFIPWFDVNITLKPLTLSLFTGQVWFSSPFSRHTQKWSSGPRYFIIRKVYFTGWIMSHGYDWGTKAFCITVVTEVDKEYLRQKGKKEEWNLTYRLYCLPSEHWNSPEVFRISLGSFATRIPFVETIPHIICFLHQLFLSSSLTVVWQMTSFSCAPSYSL